MAHQRHRLLGRVAVAAEADDLGLTGHAASLGSGEMNAPTTLAVGDRTYRIHRLAEVPGVAIERLPYTLRVLLEGALRAGDEAGVQAVATWEPHAEPSNELSFAPGRVLLQDFTGVPAVVDLAAMRDAMAELGGDPARDQPVDPGRARDRPLGAGGRVREPDGLRAQRRARARAQPRALRVPALGPAGVRRLQGRAARHRHLPPGQPRVPRPRGRGPRRRRVPGHGRRHRLAHDDGQRPRRARLGRGRDRGRGGDARRAALDARAAGRRLPSATAGCAKARPRPTSCSR